MSQLPKLYAVNLASFAYTSTGANASFPLTNLKDYRESSLWKGANTSAQNLTVDMGSQVECDTLILVSSNHRSMTGVVLYSSNDPATILDGVIFNLQSQTRDYNNNIVDVYHFTAQTKQYWRLDYVDTNSLVPQAGQFWLCKRLTFETECEGPLRAGFPAYQTALEYALNGEPRGAQAIAGRREWRLQFTAHSDTFMSNYETLYRTARGALRPVYFVDTNGQLWYVIMPDDQAPVKVGPDASDLREFRLQSYYSTY